MPGLVQGVAVGDQYTVLFAPARAIRCRQVAAGIVADAVKFVPTVVQVIRRKAKDTITPVTLNYGDVLEFRLLNGQIRKIKLVSTSAEVVSSNNKDSVQTYKWY